MADAQDTFVEVTSDTTLASHTPTPDGGFTWVIYSGSAGSATVVALTDNVKDHAGNNPTYYADVTPTSAEYDVQIDTTGTADCLGPAGRIATDADTNYRCLWINGAGEWRLVERLAGISTTIGTYVGDDPDGTVRTVLLEIRDASKKVYIGGVERISHTTTNDISAAGKPGIKFSGVTSDRGDNWSFTNTVAASTVKTMALMGVGT